MKKIGLFLLIVCLLSCSKKDENNSLPSHKPAVTVISPILPAPPVSKSFVGSSWSLMVPDGFEKTDSKSPTMEGLFVNKEKKVLISVVKESFVGSTPDYAFLGTLAMKHNGVSTTDPVAVTIDDQDITMIEANIDDRDIHVWVWMTVKNGYGYTLSCGGGGDPSEFKDLCNGLIASFKIN